MSKKQFLILVGFLMLLFLLSMVNQANAPPWGNGVPPD